MSAGTWKLTLAAVEPGNTATIEVVPRGSGDTWPEVFHDRSGITFRWQDGRSVTYFAANLLSAEFTPKIPRASSAGGGTDG